MPSRKTATVPARELPLIIRDTREKEGQGWWFESGTAFGGTLQKKLDTGDYSIAGLEKVVTVERKGSASEFVGNLYQPRFLAELKRMADIEFPVVLLEFEYEELHLWHKRHPRIRRVPRHWKVPGAIPARFWETRLKFPHVEFLFAGLFGQEATLSLFKRVLKWTSNT